MSEIKIIENSLSKENLQIIKNLFFSNEFPWFYNSGINYLNDGFCQFTHVFYSQFTINSPHFITLKPIVDLLDPLSILRIKANFLTKTHTIIKHGFHTDEPWKGKTAIFYVNTNNGFTEFENGFKSSSEENKLIIFDNFINHTGTSCTDKNERIVINFNYVEKKINNV